MRPLVLPAAGVLGLTMLVVTRVEPPTDLGSWAQGPLAGEVVVGMDSTHGAIVVTTLGGLFRVHGDGSSEELGVDGPVRTVAAAQSGELWAGTDDGLVVVADGRTPVTTAFGGEAVQDLDVRDGTAVAGTDSGVHIRADERDWQRVWPGDDQPDVEVGAVLSAPRGLLFAHPEGLALLRPDGEVDVVVPDVSVVALGHWADDGSLWAGTRGGPLLLRSTDGGSSWDPRSSGLGYTAVQALAADPSREGDLLVGGTGLADGTGNAGVQRTDDNGATWTADQDRLTNTHVYALATRTEPLRLDLRLAGTDAATSLALPVSTTRWYAGTNGGGISTLRPDVPPVSALAAAAPFLALLEPLLGGALLLFLLVPAYRLLRGSHAPAPRGRSASGRPTDPAPSTDHSNAPPT